MAQEPAALDWEALRYFAAAARTKSLSGAARALGVEHTTVGRRLTSLERSLGAALVERGPAGLLLTRLGRRVFRSAQEMERIAATIAGLANAERTRVRVVVPTGFTALLTPHLQDLSRKEPTLSLEIVSSARRADLRKGEADLALRVGPIDDEGLVARKLGDVGSALYGSRSYLSRRPKVDPDDLRGHAVIGFHRSLAEMPAARWLAERSAGTTIVLRSREAVDLLTAVKSGGGLAVLPCFLGDGEPTLVRLTPQPIATRRLSLVYRRDGRLSPELRAVVSLIVESLRAHAKQLSGS
ncbi:MAG TPA: LysR family transcriptional regulator [Polyangiaceae bacterium]|nr:LysR family transcriptional regulator [Polyangiaceae bacterium]